MRSPRSSTQESDAAPHKKRKRKPPTLNNVVKAWQTVALSILKVAAVKSGNEVLKGPTVKWTRSEVEEPEC
jgi:hypothetical protein